MAARPMPMPAASRIDCDTLLGVLARTVGQLNVLMDVNELNASGQLKASFSRTVKMAKSHSRDLKTEGKVSYGECLISRSPE
jgi:hypothetical protein